MPSTAQTMELDSATSASFALIGARLEFGAVTYRVWAPDQADVRVAIGDKEPDFRFVSLKKDADGFFSGRDAQGRAGDLYRFKLGDKLAPDPASRFQPQGV